MHCTRLKTKHNETIKLTHRRAINGPLGVYVFIKQLWGLGGHIVIVMIIGVEVYAVIFIGY